MRAYVGTTGAMFVLLVAAHVARLIAEGSGPLRDPVFVVTTLASVAMVVWAVIVWKRLAVRG
jgi:hypothetical protein